MARLAVLIAHKHQAANDAALAVALDCLVRHTRTDYELLVDSTTPACPYRVLNTLVRQTAAEWIVFSNSDVFMAPGWDEPLLEQAAPQRIVTGVIVEPGAIGVNILNHQHNFGMTPERFDRAAFERWVAETPETPAGAGWYFPSLHHRETFLDFGAFDTTLGHFPAPLDAIYWDRWLAAGREVVRAQSYSYHLQQYSSEAEQEKAVRHA